MNCPKCNAPVPGDSAFCPECGAKVEAPVQQTAAPVVPAAFCPECGAPMAAGAAFCDNCGAQTGTAAPAEAPAAKKPAAKWLKLGIAAVALVAIVILVISLFGGSKPNFALYRKDDSLMYSKLSGKPFEITDESTGTHWINKDGSKLFYTEDGKLYVRNVEKAKAEPQQLAKGVSGFQINEKGTMVFFMKEGNLRWCDLKDNGDKIASDVTYYRASPDGKTLIYVTYSDGEYELYRATVSGKKINSIKIDSAEKTSDYPSISENFKYVVYKADDDLYMQTGKKEAVKIDSEASIVGPVYDNGSFYYTVTEEDEDEDGRTTYETSLYFWNGKKGTQVAKDYSGTYSMASEAAVLCYYYTEYNDDEAETTYYVAVKAKASELKVEDVHDMAIKPNGKEMLIVADYDEKDGSGTVYKASIGSAVKAPKKVDGVEDVYYVYYINDGKKTVFQADADGETYTLYVNGKKISDDVSGWNYSKESGMFVYKTDESKGEYSLWQLKGSKGKKINDDVYSFMFTPDGTLLYLCDQEKGEGTLYRTTNGEGKQIDTEVTGLVGVNYYAD